MTEQKTLVPKDDGANLMRITDGPALTKEQILEEVRTSLAEARNVATKSTIALWFASKTERDGEEVKREALALYQQQIKSVGRLHDAYVDAMIRDATLKGRTLNKATAVQFVTELFALAERRLLYVAQVLNEIIPQYQSLTSLPEKVREDLVTKAIARVYDDAAMLQSFTKEAGELLASVS